MSAREDLARNFETLRPRAFALAYRMLGSAAEAEDIVQEAWLRRAKVSGVVSEAAWMTTTVTRLCLDHLKSARVRREAYVGPWLPEPVASTDLDEAIDPESISTAFLLLLERLTPSERAVLLLRQVFEMEYEAIASVLDKSEAAIRQLHHRAKAHLDDHRPRFAPTRDQHLKLLNSFVQAVGTGDLQRVEDLLAGDVESWNDGGGRRRAALQVVSGVTNVAKLHVGIAKKFDPTHVRFDVRDINGAPSLVVWEHAEILCTLSIESDGEKIHGIYVALNPEKLTRISAKQTH